MVRREADGGVVEERAGGATAAHLNRVTCASVQLGSDPIPSAVAALAEPTHGADTLLEPVCLVITEFVRIGRCGPARGRLGGAAAVRRAADGV